MGAGYSGIYTSTYGERWTNAKLYAAAPAVADFTAEDVLRALLVAGGVYSAAELAGTLGRDLLIEAGESLAHAVAAGDAGEVLGGALPEGVSENQIKELIPEALATALAAWLATRAEELGLDDYWNQQDERPGIYENCKLADSVLTALWLMEPLLRLDGVRALVKALLLRCGS